MKKIIKYFLIWIIGVCSGIVCFLWFERIEEQVNAQQTEDINIVWRQNHFLLTEENLYNELIAQGVDFPQIVLAQAILETGHFKSNACVSHNNLFGIRCFNGVYKDYNHWTDCVASYKKYIQKYNDLPTDYYKYLDELSYAEDSLYTQKLKQIVKCNLQIIN